MKEGLSEWANELYRVEKPQIIQFVLEGRKNIITNIFNSFMLANHKLAVLSFKAYSLPSPDVNIFC